ncbi:hypothetical protein BKA61DRAFT_497263 [Leptodontidium sp. MPI-SDFR-AT-0119]|nr:hypothetical protein BKA61DRAFT_497263 [Leptodontidium sp. MPI-SDFR-AT-0119]
MTWTLTDVDEVGPSTIIYTTTIPATTYPHNAITTSSRISTTSIPTSTTSSSSTAPTSTAIPISTDGRCGKNVNDKTCKGSSFGPCCSAKGNCGNGPFFCGVSNECQPKFGKCTPLSTDGKCGAASSTDAMCQGHANGNCCSVKGNCGSTPAFCAVANLCQPAYGTCATVSTDGKCGSASSVGAICLGSTFGNCCSVKGNCGSSDAFCKTSNLCQPTFGNCT